MSKPDIQEPTLVSEDHHGQTYEHPAFAQVRASRVSGRAVLYGSDFVHQNFVTITISKSQLQRSLAREWHFGSHEIITVALSEAQWATFVSSMNMGSGVPCTIERQTGVGLVPGLPNPAPLNAYRADIAEDTKEAINALQKALDVAAEKKVPKAVVAEIEAAMRAIRGSIPFVAEQFNRHMEEVVESAKVEIHGYANHVLQSAGIAALAPGSDPIALEFDAEATS